MPSTVQKLYEKGLLKQAPKFLPNNTHYEVIMGSVAYGVSNEMSDMDIYGFCIPPKDYIFPHLRGEIVGFDDSGPRFEQFQIHHIVDPSALAGKGQEYDLAIYSIVKYFRLCMENNPNMIDSLFVPRRCILHSTALGERIREKRKLFLHKGAWHKFKGYAYSQMHKMRIKQPTGKRKKLLEDFGYDVKFAYHVVRLLNEVEQILIEQDLDLERNREQLKAIRRGEWTLEQLESYFHDKEKSLEELYSSSQLPHSPDKNEIKTLLLECLEQHYGKLDTVINQDQVAIQALRQIDKILENVRNNLDK